MEQPVNLNVQNPPPVVNSEPVAPKKRNSLFLFILLVVVVLAGLLFFAYSLGQKKIAKVQPYLAPTSAPQPTVTLDATANWKTYTDTELEFSVKYPNSWFLISDVLTSYDASNYSSKLPFPENSIKCDFNYYDSSNEALTGEKVFVDGNIKIYKGKVEDKTGTEGPGLGDAVFFKIDDSVHKPVGLLCFKYSDTLEELLRKTLSTFKFLE